AARVGLLDLVTAREAVGDDQGLAGCAADGGEDAALAAGARDLVVRRLVAPSAGPPAAAAVGRHEMRPHAAEELLLRLDAARRGGVAVALEDDVALEPRRLVALPRGEELPEVDPLVGGPLCVPV